MFQPSWFKTPAPTNKPIGPQGMPARDGKKQKGQQRNKGWIPVVSSWCKAYRWFVPGDYYRLYGAVIQFHVLEIQYRDGWKHAYKIPANVFASWKRTFSHGGWVNRILLGRTLNKRWKVGDARYENWPAN